VTVTGVDNALVDGTRQTGVTVGVDAARSDDAFDGAPAQTVQVTVTDDDAAGFALADTARLVVTELGDTDAFAVVLTARPSADVVLDVTSADVGEAAVSPATLTFSPTTWNTPQTVTLTGVDDALTDGNVVTIVTVSVDVPASAAEYAGVGDRTVAVTTVDDDTPGFTVATSAGTTVSEGGPGLAITVVLTAQPASNVVLAVASGDPSVVGVSPSNLTFPPGSWDQPQTVTVTGVDNELVDGTRQAGVTVGVDAAASDDAFDGAPAQTVQVTVTDDDAAGFALADTVGLVVTESGDTDAFTVVLTGQPSADVVFDVTSADVGEATVSPATLTFSPTTWNTPQPVTLTGVDDALTDGDVVTIVTVSVDVAASAAEYASVGDRTVAVTTVDDDTPGFTVATSAGTTVSEGGPGLAITVVLTAQPASNVVHGR
jgi:hypothetical protein